MTYVDACKHLFEQTSTSYDFAGVGVKNKQNYKYPIAETNTDRSKVNGYLAIRKISSETLDCAGIKQDKHGNIVFEYYDEDNVLLLVKYRPARKIDKSKGDIKEWCHKDKDTSPLLFNMNRIDPTKPLIICEGEIDCLSLIESGFKNSVSVPFGANNYGWVEYNWDWLEQFVKIIIWSDNDEAGTRMKNEVIPRLGEWRCYEATGTKKDINLELYYNGKEKIEEIINNAKEVPISKVIDMADVKDLDLSKMEKIKSNLNGLDKWISGFYLGTVDIITGINGSGKSTFINQVCICEPVQQGYKTFIFSGELTNRQLKSWILYPMAGRRHIQEIDRG
jgi:twinkle protein